MEFIMPDSHDECANQDDDDPPGAPRRWLLHPSIDAATLFDPRPYEIPGHVYIAWCTTRRLVKIGFTTQPVPSRARQLGVSRILDTLPGTRSDEQAWHARFAYARVGTSEWFALDPRLAEALFRRAA
jgi:hypothetical protein